ncbi:hypothetical protein Tco_1362660 [Tanacetum coccineum]
MIHWLKSIKTGMLPKLDYVDDIDPPLRSVYYFISVQGVSVWDGAEEVQYTSTWNQKCKNINFLKTSANTELRDGPEVYE